MDLVDHLRVQFKTSIFMIGMLIIEDIDCLEVWIDRLMVSPWRERQRQREYSKKKRRMEKKCKRHHPLRSYDNGSFISFLCPSLG